MQHLGNGMLQDFLPSKHPDVCFPQELHNVDNSSLFETLGGSGRLLVVVAAGLLLEGREAERHIRVLRPQGSQEVDEGPIHRSVPGPAPQNNHGQRAALEMGQNNACLSAFGISQGSPVDLVDDVTRGDKHVDVSLTPRHQVQDKDTPM